MQTIQLDSKRLLHRILILKPHFRFKSIDDLRTHCKLHNELKCRICSDVFCKQIDLIAHQEQGCEALIESPDLVDSKPTFIDCNLELDVNLEQPEETSFDCGIVPKEIDSSDDDSFNGIDQNGDEDDSNHVEISADNETSQPGPSNAMSNARATNKTKTKKSQKRSTRKRKRNVNEHESDTGDRMYHCYLCEKK